MNKLNLNFLTDIKKQDTWNIYDVMNKYGRLITNYARDYVSYTITTASDNDVIKTYSLYLLVPEIGYDYRVISVDITGLDFIQLTYLPLITKKTETYRINIENGSQEFENTLQAIFSHEVFNASMRILVEQVHI